MSKKTSIEINWRESGKRIGTIDFFPQGVLIYSVITKELFPSAFKPVEQFVRKNCLEIPLYQKYKKLLDQHSEIHDEVLQQEALKIAEAINKGNIRVGEKIIEANVINYIDKFELPNT